MKKLLSLVVAGFIGLLLVGCSLSESSSSSEALKTKEDVLGFSALTSIKALSLVSDNEAAPMAEALSYSYIMNNEEKPVEETPVEETPVEEQPVVEAPELLEIEPFLAIMKSFKEKEGFTVTVKESDNEDYEVLMNITLVDIDGSPLEYEFYYNETVVDEEKSTIDGIMIISGVTYFLEGEKEFEVDGDETEEELELKAYLDEDNYVLLSYEIETETDEIEKEFKYSIYQNGELVRSIEIEFEEEEDETELKISFTENSTKRTYEFEIEDGEIEVKYEVKVDGETVLKSKAKVVITKDEETGKDIITYIYGEDDDEFTHEYESDDDDDEDVEDYDDEDLEDEDLENENLDDENLEDENHEDENLDDEDESVEDSDK